MKPCVALCLTCVSAAAPPPLLPLLLLLLLLLLASTTITSLPLGRCSRQTTTINELAGGLRHCPTANSLVTPTRHACEQAHAQTDSPSDKQTDKRGIMHTYTHPTQPACLHIIFPCTYSCAAMPWQSITEHTLSFIQPTDLCTLNCNELNCDEVLQSECYDYRAISKDSWPQASHQFRPNPELQYNVLKNKSFCTDNDCLHTFAQVLAIVSGNAGVAQLHRTETVSVKSDGETIGCNMTLRCTGDVTLHSSHERFFFYSMRVASRCSRERFRLCKVQACGFMSSCSYFKGPGYSLS